MASPTKQTETVRANRDRKIAKNRSKKFHREAPSKANLELIQKFEKLLKTK